MKTMTMIIIMILIVILLVTEHLYSVTSRARLLETLSVVAYMRSLRTGLLSFSKTMLREQQERSINRAQLTDYRRQFYR